MKELLRKLFRRDVQEDTIDEEDFWSPGNWPDNHSLWDQWNG